MSLKTKKKTKREKMIWTPKKIENQQYSLLVALPTTYPYYSTPLRSWKTLTDTPFDLVRNFDRNANKSLYLKNITITSANFCAAICNLIYKMYQYICSISWGEKVMILERSIFHRNFDENTHFNSPYLKNLSITPANLGTIYRLT